MDSKGITVFYNKHCETIDGMRATEFVGKNVTELKEKGILTQPVALEVIERGHKIEKTQFINNRSIYITGTPIKRNDNVLYVVIYVRDISRLEYAKKQLIEVKQLSETMKDELNRFGPGACEGSGAAGKCRLI